MPRLAVALGLDLPLPFEHSLVTAQACLPRLIVPLLGQLRPLGELLLALFLLGSPPQGSELLRVLEPCAPLLQPALEARASGAAQGSVCLDSLRLSLTLLDLPDFELFLRTERRASRVYMK